MNLQKTQFTIIEIYNSFGQKIKKLHEGNINSGKWNHKYDLSYLSNGVYLIRVQSEKSITHQIIKF
ncbi:MAG: T9SS type A sorting domain-containing protein [Bacteroidetes bacterium]|nr:T9SS type A sorting domain-containing protein [Bacteroidota bacterium]